MKVSAKTYATLVPKDFDKFDCVKIAPGIYCILLFILRAYVTWIMSVTNMRDQVGIIQWVYADPTLFYLHLGSGAIALFVVLLLLLRKPDAPLWVKYCWQRCHVFLIFALLFDLFFTCLSYFFWHFQSTMWLYLHISLVIVALSYIMKSERFTINLQEFPEQLPEK